MTVRELIKQLQSIKNQELQVVSGEWDYQMNINLMHINNPQYDLKNEKPVINIGVLSDRAIPI